MFGAIPPQTVDMIVRTIQKNQANLKHVLDGRLVRVRIRCGQGPDSCVKFRINGLEENLEGDGPAECYPPENDGDGIFLGGGPPVSTTSAIYIGVAAGAVLLLAGSKYFLDKKKRRGVHIAFVRRLRQ